jgi:hypothetical protein
MPPESCHGRRPPSRQIRATFDHLAAHKSSEPFRRLTSVKQVTELEFEA